MVQSKIVRVYVDVEKETEPTEEDTLSDELIGIRETNDLREQMSDWGLDTFSRIFKRAQKDIDLGLGINHPVIISLINNAMTVYASFTDEFRRLNKKDHDLLIQWKKPNVFFKAMKDRERDKTGT